MLGNKIWNLLFAVPNEHLNSSATVRRLQEKKQYRITYHTTYMHYAVYDIIIPQCKTTSRMPVVW